MREDTLLDKLNQFLYDKNTEKKDLQNYLKLSQKKLPAELASELTEIDMPLTFQAFGMVVHQFVTSLTFGFVNTRIR